MSRYRFNRFLCTKGEHRFLQVLQEVVGERHTVLMQVRVGALLEARRGGPESGAFRKVAQKSFDFVLVRKGTSYVHCVIELDDSSHRRPERRARDAWLDRVCRQVGLPLLRFKVVREYDREAIRRAVEQATAPHS